MSQPLALPQLLLEKKSDSFSFKSLFFKPLRFCGRQWAWVREDNNTASKIALKVLAVPFLVCATVLAGVLAWVGAGVFKIETIPGCIQYATGGDWDLLHKDTSDRDVAKIIEARLRQGGCKWYSVDVVSTDRDANHLDYCPERVPRFITVTNPGSTRLSARQFEVVKNHFYNKDISNLKDVHRCIGQSATTEDFTRLKNVLELHPSITFYCAFDLAYIETSL